MMNAARFDTADLLASGVEQTSAHTDQHSFLMFAVTADRLSAVTKRLIKIRIVSEYFRDLDDHDLATAARFLSGQIFPVQDRRRLSIGTATVVNAIASLTGFSPEEIRVQTMIVGDFAIVAHDLFEQQERFPLGSPPLSVSEVHHRLEKLSVTSGTKLKTERLQDLLRLATPLEAKYLVMMVMGDLRVGFQESLVEEAISYGASRDVEDIQRANLVTGDIGHTAVLAKNGQLDAVRFRLFHPLKFMQATNTNLSNVGPDLPERLIVEDQLEGERVQVHLGLDLPPVGTASGIVHDGIRVAIFSQTLEDVSEKYQDLVPALGLLLPDAAGAVAANGIVLDGVIALTSYGELFPQGTLPPVFGPDHTAFVAHDLLCIDGRVLFLEPLSMRAAALDDIRFDRKRTRRVTSRHIADPQMLPAELKAARARGSEGIVLKDPRALYRPGRRSTEWIIVNEEIATLVVVVTAVEGGGAKHSPAYTIAVRASEEDSSLLAVGKTNMGLSSKDAARLTEWFRAHTIHHDVQSKIRHVEPKIVLEMTFTKVKATRRYESGYSLQMPRILRVLNDKSIAEIDTLATVRRLADVSRNS